jgi:hypothetical protein
MELDKELLEIASEIKEIIANKQKELSLTFIEDTHTYYMKDLNGEIRSDFPSISTVLHCFYKEFDATTTKAFKNCEGDKEKEDALLKEWADSGTYASHMGSRVHYLLEKHFVDLYGAYKEVRQPIFDCDEEQTKNGDGMIVAGKKFIDLMHERGAVLLDTEIVLGSPELGIVGQPDKMLLMRNKSGEIGLVVTDWKTNKKKNLITQPWTKKMLEPFTFLEDTALSHYKLQLNFYAKILLNMLKGSKYEDLPLLGCIIVHLEADGSFNEYRVPKNITDIIMDMDMSQYLPKLKAH